MQMHYSTCSLILNVMATLYRCSFNSIYHPHWLVQWSCHCSHMHIPVHSSWLPGYINVAPTVLVILTMDGLFPDRSHTSRTAGIEVGARWGAIVKICSGEEEVHHTSIKMLLCTEYIEEALEFVNVLESGSFIHFITRTETMCSGIVYLWYTVGPCYILCSDFEQAK